MRRAVVLLAVVAAMLTVAAGAAVALVVTAEIFCDGGDCVGTRGEDTIGLSNVNDNRLAAMEGNDNIFGGAQHDDEIYGDEGNDIIGDNAAFIDNDHIFGDEGNDRILVDEKTTGADEVHCGPGKKDEVFFDKDVDVIANDCEIRHGS